MGKQKTYETEKALLENAPPGENRYAKICARCNGWYFGYVHSGIFCDECSRVVK
jgi:hypothetical protein